MQDELEQQILAANQAFYRAFRDRDLNAMSVCWASALDISCVHPGRDQLIVRALVMGSWEKIFAGDSPLQVWPAQERVQGNARQGWVICHEQLAAELQGQTVDQRLIAINTFRLEEGGWKLTHHHASPILREAPSPIRNAPKPKATLH